MRRYSGDLKREGRDSVGDCGSSMEDYVTKDQRGRTGFTRNNGRFRAVARLVTRNSYVGCVEMTEMRGVIRDVEIEGTEMVP